MAAGALWTKSNENHFRNPFRNHFRNHVIFRPFIFRSCFVFLCQSVRVRDADVLTQKIRVFIIGFRLFSGLFLFGESGVAGAQSLPLQGQWNDFHCICIDMHRMGGDQRMQICNEMIFIVFVIPWGQIEEWPAHAAVQLWDWFFRCYFRVPCCWVSSESCPVLLLASTSMLSNYVLPQLPVQLTFWAYSLLGTIFSWHLRHCLLQQFSHPPLAASMQTMDGLSALASWKDALQPCSWHFLHSFPSASLSFLLNRLPTFFATLLPEVAAGYMAPKPLPCVQSCASPSMCPLNLELVWNNQWRGERVNSCVSCHHLSCCSDLLIVFDLPLLLSLGPSPSPCSYSWLWRTAGKVWVIIIKKACVINNKPLHPFSSYLGKHSSLLLFLFLFLLGCDLACSMTWGFEGVLFLFLVRNSDGFSWSMLGSSLSSDLCVPLPLSTVRYLHYLATSSCSDWCTTRSRCVSLFCWIGGLFSRKWTGFWLVNSPYWFSQCCSWRRLGILGGLWVGVWDWPLLCDFHPCATTTTTNTLFVHAVSRGISSIGCACVHLFSIDMLMLFLVLCCCVMNKGKR